MKKLCVFLLPLFATFAWGDGSYVRYESRYQEHRSQDSIVVVKDAAEYSAVAQQPVEQAAAVPPEEQKNMQKVAPAQVSETAAPAVSADKDAAVQTPVGQEGKAPVAEQKNAQKAEPAQVQAPAAPTVSADKTAAVQTPVEQGGKASVAEQNNTQKAEAVQADEAASRKGQSSEVPPLGSAPTAPASGREQLPEDAPSSASSTAPEPTEAGDTPSLTEAKTDTTPVTQASAVSAEGAGRGGEETLGFLFLPLFPILVFVGLFILIVLDAHLLYLAVKRGIFKEMFGKWSKLTWPLNRQIPRNPMTRSAEEPVPPSFEPRTPNVEPPVVPPAGDHFEGSENNEEAPAPPTSSEVSAPVEEKKSEPAAPVKKSWAVVAAADELPEPLLHPYPSFMAPAWLTEKPELTETLPPTPTVEEMDALLTSPVACELQEYCRSREGQVKIAQDFLRTVAGKPDGAGVLLRADSSERHYWFTGDIHGSFVALLKIYAFVQKQAHSRSEGGMGGRHTLIILGDVVDRGTEVPACLALIQKMLMQATPFETFFVRGNHDVGLYRKDDGSFASTVLPSETADELNQLREADTTAAEVLGKAAMELARTAPCMGEITGVDMNIPSHTILFTHGGVPHVDLQEKLYGLAPQGGEDVDCISGLPESLRRECCKDFTWVRMVERLPKKMPNRGSSGCEMGTEDVNAFRRLHYLRTGRAVSFIVRGHDHRTSLDSYDECYNPTHSRFVQRKCHVLTLQTREPDLNEGALSASRDLALLHWRRCESAVLYILPTHHLAPQRASAAVSPVTEEERNSTNGEV